jgi:hypothetical protein
MARVYSGLFYMMVPRAGTAKADCIDKRQYGTQCRHFADSAGRHACKNREVFEQREAKLAVELQQNTGRLFVEPDRN